MRQGRRLGRNLAAQLTGHGEMRPFVWRNVGGVCSLGRYQGRRRHLRLQDPRLPGVVPGTELPPLRDADVARRVRIAIDWTVALLFPRDITQLGSFEHPREPFERAARRQ